MAVKLEKWLTAREIRGKKKHKILWWLKCSEGVFCGGQYPFCFGLYLGKADRTSKRPASAGRFELQGHLQFLQFLASEAFLEAFACLPAFALELSLAAEACLPFALDPVFSDFCLSRVVCRFVRGFIHRLRGYSPRTPPCGGIIPPHPLARVLHPRAPASHSVRFRRHCAALRRSARLPHGCSLSHRENADVRPAPRFLTPLKNYRGAL